MVRVSDQAATWRAPVWAAVRPVPAIADPMAVRTPTRVVTIHHSAAAAMLAAAVMVARIVAVAGAGGMRSMSRSAGAVGSRWIHQSLIRSTSRGHQCSSVPEVASGAGVAVPRSVGWGLWWLLLTRCGSPLDGGVGYRRTVPPGLAGGVAVGAA